MKTALTCNKACSSFGGENYISLRIFTFRQIHNFGNDIQATDLYNHGQKVWDEFTGVSRFCQNNTKMLQFPPLFIVRFVKSGYPVISG